MNNIGLFANENEFVDSKVVCCGFNIFNFFFDFLIFFVLNFYCFLIFNF